MRQLFVIGLLSFCLPSLVVANTAVATSNSDVKGVTVQESKPAAKAPVKPEPKPINSTPVKKPEPKPAPKPKSDVKTETKTPPKPDPKKVTTPVAATTPPPKKLKVVTTLSVIAAITRELGGALVEVNALSTATEDPHFVKAKPTFKRLVSEADLFIQNGRSLELWVPLVLASANNPKLSGTGLVEASKGFKSLEVPTKLSRDAGDIHPQGNPHVWLSPLGGLKMAENIKNALVAKDPSNKATYEKNYGAFKQNLAISLFGKDLVSAGSADFLFRQHDSKQLKSYVEKKGKSSLGGWVKLSEQIDYQFLSYHTVFSYLVNEFNLKIFSPIEEKSGVEPSLKQQNKIIADAKAANVKHIVAASYYIGMKKLLDHIAKEIGGQMIFVDVDCRAGETYVDMINRLLNAFVSIRPAPSPPKTIK